MKITPESEVSIEVKAEQEQKKHIEFNTSRRKIPGLTLWEYNIKTKHLKPAEFIKERVVNFVDIKPTGNVKVDDTIHRKLLQSEECLYFQKLNRANAIKHLKKRYNLTVEA